MDWKNLTPWLTLAVTLALSILVPLFTQIANNKFQLKMYENKRKEEKERETYNKLVETYETFIICVSECLGAVDDNIYNRATASINRLYSYAPKEWWTEIDSLSNHIIKYEWDDARGILRNLSKKIAIELDKYKA